MTNTDQEGPGLRTLSSVVSAVLALTATIVCLSLIILGVRMQGATERIRDAMSSVGMTQNAALDLLAYGQGRSGPASIRLESEIRQNLFDARADAASPEVVGALDEAEKAVNAYLSARSRGASEERLFELLQSADRGFHRVEQLNIAEADAALARVLGWNQVSNLVGIVAALLMLVTIATSVWWTRRAVIKPVVATSQAMERFSGGALGARAEERGAQEVRHMAERFNTLASTVARAHRARLSYLAEVAHDLRNPLAALQLSVAALTSESAPPSPARQREVVLVIQRQVLRLNRMVVDLLESARIDAGYLELHPENADLRRVVTGVIALFEGSSPLHAVHVALPDESLEVRCDPLRIEQALSSIVGNSIRRTPEGGEINVALHREGNSAVLSVTDQGLRLSPAELGRIWEPFQHPGASHETVPGIGLGLWIARRIVDAHGGQVSAESNPESGTMFSIRLSAEPEARPPTAQFRAPLSQSAATET